MQVRTLCRELPERVGRQVHLEGWVHRIRDFGGVRFMVLRDRSGQGQVILTKDTDLGDINCEWVVAVDGTCRREPRAPGGVEVANVAIDTISPAQPPPLEVFSPKSARKNRLETLLDNRAVSLRLGEIQDVFRLQAEVLDAFRSYLRSHGFVEIVTPKFVLAGAEGGAAVFEVEYFDRKAYLAQSPQFYKQIMVGSGLERVFETGHAYRAEKSETSRHLTEYLSLDFELGFVESEQDVMRMHTAVIGAIIETVRSRCGDILERYGATLPQISEIPQIAFPEAKRILAERFNKTAGLDGDLDTAGEQLLGQWAEDELDSELIYVTGYHVDRRPMYTMPNTDAPPLTRSFDLLFRGVEITTGGQRIHDYDQLVENMRRQGLRPDEFAGYLATFKHGMCPHGGVGMGIERLIKQMLGLPNIKQASAFPRDRHRLSP